MRLNVAHMQPQPSKTRSSCRCKVTPTGEVLIRSWGGGVTYPDTADTLGEPCVTGATRVQTHMTTANVLFR